MQHLVMFNQSQCDLHHPGNVVSCCKSCNSRKKEEDGFVDWEGQLLEQCGDDLLAFKERKQRIINHIESEDYPKLTEDEVSSLKAVASHFCRSTKSELDKSLDLYEAINETLGTERSR